MHQYFICFYDWAIFHYMDLPHSIYPFISWWTFELLTSLGSYEKFCYEYLCTNYVNICFQFSWLYPRSGICQKDHMLILFNIWRDAKLFSKEAIPFTFPPAMQEGFNFSTSLPTFAIVCLFFIITTLLCEKWYLIVVFTSIFKLAYLWHFFSKVHISHLYTFPGELLYLNSLILLFLPVNKWTVFF